MTANKQQLRELAEAAGGNPWSWWTSCSFLRLTFDGGSDGGAMSAFVCVDGVASIECSKGVQEFIAAANPAAVLALLDKHEALQAECEKLRKDAELYLKLRGLSHEKLGTPGIPCVAVPEAHNKGRYVSGEDLDAAMEGGSHESH